MGVILDIYEYWPENLGLRAGMPAMELMCVMSLTFKVVGCYRSFRARWLVGTLAGARAGESETRAPEKPAGERGTGRMYPHEDGSS